MALRSSDTWERTDVKTETKKEMSDQEYDRESRKLNNEIAQEIIQQIISRNQIINIMKLTLTKSVTLYTDEEMTQTKIYHRKAISRSKYNALVALSNQIDSEPDYEKREVKGLAFLEKCADSYYGINKQVLDINFEKVGPIVQAAFLKTFYKIEDEDDQARVINDLAKLKDQLLKFEVQDIKP